MQAGPNLPSTISRWKGRSAWWLYNVSMGLGLMLTAPLLVALATASRKRRRSAAHRMGLRRPEVDGRTDPATPVIWVHALSVGEVTAAQPLIHGLRKRYDGCHIILTASTHTGFETARRLFAGKGAQVSYFPYDFIFSVRAAAHRFDPTIAILVETDIWPNFLNEMKRRGVPVYLVNFRLSDRTWRICRAFRGVCAGIFDAFERIFVQAPRDLSRLERLGIAEERLCLAGSLKFDNAPQSLSAQRVALWRRQLGLAEHRPVIVAGSTHEGDEAAVLKALATLGDSNPQLEVTLVIAPRDPERSRSLVDLCRKTGLSCELLTVLQNCDSPSCPDVVMVDYIGVLRELYGLATLAFIGGSLSNEGGHNPLEPAVLAKPVLFGPDMRDFRQMAGWLLEGGGARQVADESSLGDAFAELLRNPDAAATMGRRAQSVYRCHRGAVARIIERMELHRTPAVS